jgi:DNA polymerase-1
MKTLVIVDINNFIYRAYFGIQHRLQAPDGRSVNAVFGVFNMIHSMLQKLDPTAVVIAKDSNKSFRKDIFPDYKNNRSHMPEDLFQQVPLIYQMLDLMSFSSVESSGFEADDVIYSLAKQYSQDFEQVYIATGDKDLFQLVDDKVKCVDTMKDKIYGKQEVQEKLGISPNQVVDFLSLIGDSSDNIPGVSGIGEKTAVKLIKEHGSLAGIYSNIEKLAEGKIKQNLIKEEAIAKMSYELASLKEIPTLNCDFNYSKTPSPELISFFEKLNMKSIVEKLKKSN